jgi:hypothetical protein
LSSASEPRDHDARKSRALYLLDRAELRIDSDLVETHLLDMLGAPTRLSGGPIKLTLANFANVAGSGRWRASNDSIDPFDQVL